METIEQKVAKEINETPVVVKIGNREFPVKPLTFGQIIDISAVVSTMGEITKDDMGRDIITVNFEHMDDMEKMIDIASIVLYREVEERTPELRRFLRAHLTEENYIPLQEMYMERLETGFFLNNLIFLKKYLNVTKPTKVTLPGRSGSEQ